MAHFAILDNENTVLNVVVINNEDIQDLPFPESEPIGINFLASTYGEVPNCKQTSYNSNFRTRYAQIGGSYSPEHDAFLSPKPFPSWYLDETDLEWWPPVPYPDDTGSYYWDEDTVQWVEYPSQPPEPSE